MRTHPEEHRREFVAHVHKYHQDQITLADAKAAVITGLAAGLFVAYREVIKDWRFVQGTVDAESWARGLLQIPFLLFVFLSVVHSYIVILPRMPDAYRRARFGLEGFHRALEWLARRVAWPLDLGGGGRLVRWPDVADSQRYPSTSSYAVEVLKTSDSDLTADLAEHSAVLARIVAEKFQHVRLALNYLLLAGFLVALLSLLGQLGRQ